MKHFLTFPCFAVLPLLLALSATAQDSAPGVNSGGAAAQQARTGGPSGQLDFQTDLFTGRFGYSVPMELAPARNGSAPGVSLRYNSTAESGWCGMGWDLDLGFIERETRRGVPVRWANGSALAAYDDAKGFVFSLNGQSSSLVSMGGNEYRAEIEGGFLTFQLQTNVNRWVITDKSGNHHYFGQSSITRMSNPKAGWASNTVSGTFRWALDRTETVNGDVTSITYTNLSGRLYPQLLSYNGHTSGITNSCTVQFLLAARTDVTISLKSGFRVDQTRLLDSVVHRVAGALVWSNKLGYVASSSTQRALLNSVTRFGTNGTESLPPVRFDYSRLSFSFQSPVNWTNIYLPSGGDQGYYNLGGPSVDLTDMDGDGLPDRVTEPVFAPYTFFWVQRNTGAGFGPPQTWQLGHQVYGVSSTSNNYYWEPVQSSHGRLVF